MAKKEETKIQDAVRLALSKEGCKVFRCNVGNFITKWGSEIKIGTPGHSDIYGVKPGGRAFFLELKTPVRKRYRYTKEFYSCYERNRSISRICTFCRRCIKNSISRKL